MEKEFVVKILALEEVTHDVKRIVIEKPVGYKFIPGQATDVAINESGWKEKKSPFTFTCLNENSYLEFTIKIYLEREGMTKKINELKINDELIITESFGSVNFKGKGVFIAGGAGVTPFIAILRQLRFDNELEGNTLIFSNKTERDIILKNEFDTMSKEGLKVVYTLTHEKNNKYENKIIDENFLSEKISDFSKYFYICGPIRMVGETQYFLKKLGADEDKIVVET